MRRSASSATWSCVSTHPARTTASSAGSALPKRSDAAVAGSSCSSSQLAAVRYSCRRTLELRSKSVFCARTGSRVWVHSRSAASQPQATAAPRALSVTVRVLLCWCPRFSSSARTRGSWCLRTAEGSTAGCESSTTSSAQSLFTSGKLSARARAQARHRSSALASRARRPSSPASSSVVSIASPSLAPSPDVAHTSACTSFTSCRRTSSAGSAKGVDPMRARATSATCPRSAARAPRASAGGSSALRSSAKASSTCAESSRHFSASSPSSRVRSRVSTRHSCITTASASGSSGVAPPGKSLTRRFSARVRIARFSSLRALRSRCMRCLSSAASPSMAARASAPASA
mmetsp:Transcript_15651/g.47683  ORF Transcript_15651/g.47683 Transcript_15651/m.47683 type:complete len:346 (-) Transcript_15651:196-1233(-)